MSIALIISPEKARRFMRRSQLLDAPVANVNAALAHLGYIQIDPINVCGRIHDLILRNRVQGYREGDLHSQIHSPPRSGFEHYIPQTGVLAAFPGEAWAYLAPLVERRRLRRNPAYRCKLSPKNELLAQRILGEIRDRGPLTSDDIEHEGRSATDWGTPGRLVKNLLEVMFVHGRVLISARRGFRRVYDLPERVLRSAWLPSTTITEKEIARWALLLRFRQRRLVMLKRRELFLVDDVVQRIAVAGCPPLYCLLADLPLFDSPECNPSHTKKSADISQPVPLLLAPLDPLIYDRRLTATLWNFNYTWEVYTPPARRVRGYYALPVLFDTELVGHIDPKADRENHKLKIVSRSLRRGTGVAPAIRELAKFLGLK